jgi:hypothetical protein
MFADRKTPKDYIKVGLAGKLAQGAGEYLQVLVLGYARNSICDIFIRGVVNKEMIGSDNRLE